MCKKFQHTWVLIWLSYFLATQVMAEEVGSRSAELSSMVLDASYEFHHVRNNPSTEGIVREVLGFEVDGLSQYALLLRPAGAAPKGGWPVVQFNHGFHPNPPLNGFNAAGESDRPGDYYRETVQAFARAGFAVIAPDYRGHNVSEGEEFTQRVLADVWYSRDAIACFLALSSLADLNLDRAYMLGHSMGGPITLRAMQALGDRVRAGSVWSTAGSDKHAQLMAITLKAVNGEDNNESTKALLNALASELNDLAPGTTADQLSAISQAALIRTPLSIQHSFEDQATPVSSSLELAARLYLADGVYQLNVVPGEEHLFIGEAFSAAVARDVQWFQRHR
ncbi:MAG: alpha/beta fold hydrolase [Halioglobus sp.]